MNSTMIPDGYIRVASTSDISEGDLKRVELDSGKVVVLAKVRDTYYAIGGICKHEDWDLSEGVLEGHHLICNGHGARWDLFTGFADYAEALENEPIYGVKVIDEEIFITQEPIERI